MNSGTIYTFLLWSTLINLGLFVFSLIVTLAIKDFVFKLHHSLFSIEQSAFNNMLYGFLGLYKLLIIFFNVVPLLVVGCLM